MHAAGTSDSRQRKPLHPHGLKAQRLYGLFCKTTPALRHACPTRPLPSEAAVPRNESIPFSTAGDYINKMKLNIDFIE
jgi:hypothetical protein